MEPSFSAFCDEGLGEETHPIDEENKWQAQLEEAFKLVMQPVLSNVVKDSTTDDYVKMMLDADQIQEIVD
jgi:hypothetical protein